MISIIALAVLPALILIYYTYQQDKLQREPVKNLVRAFFYGWLSVFVSLCISVPMMGMGLFSEEITSLQDAARTAFGFWGFFGHHHLRGGHFIVHICHNP